MKIAAYLGMGAGLVLMVALVLWQGLGEVLQLLFASSWWLLLLPLVWLPCLLPAVASWRLLFAPERTPGFARTAVALWIGRAINTLLPVATIGGEVAKARLIALWGASGVDASASVVVDKTVQALSVVLWGVCGAGLLLWLALDDTLVAYVLLGMVVLAGGIAGFVLVQHRGMVEFSHRLTLQIIRNQPWREQSALARAVDERVREVYADPWRVTCSVLLRLLGLVLQTAEVWLAARLLGHPLGLAEALMLKSLSSTLSDVAFVIPNSYGVQEGAYVVLGALMGLPADFMLALSLATRLRELLVDLPGLLAWQHVEGTALLRRRRAARA